MRKFLSFRCESTSAPWPEALQPLTHVDMFPSYENCLNRIIAAWVRRRLWKRFRGKVVPMVEWSMRTKPPIL